MASFIQRNKNRLFALGLFLIIVPRLVLLYLMMPFPGSQSMDALRSAYFLYNWQFIFLSLGLLLAVPPFLTGLSQSSNRKSLGLGIWMLLAIGAWVLAGRMSADQMFKEPQRVAFLAAAENRLPGHTLVLGIERDGVAKAYPLRLLAYHHQVVDSIGNEPLAVTYCTMCRTGKVFSRRLNGRTLELDLIGALQYNATFREPQSGSWWRQATGEFVTGPLQGQALGEVYAENVTLASWLARYPNSLIMQPDPASAEGYELFEFPLFDQKRDTNALIDPAAPAPKSWVVGLHKGLAAKAYPWKTLVQDRLIHDSFEQEPVLVALESDTLSFHVWDRRVNGQALDFEPDSAGGFIDRQTRSTWNWQGMSTAGPLRGQQLTKINASQEFFRSWATFHPATTVYQPPTRQTAN